MTGNGKSNFWTCFLEDKTILLADYHPQLLNISKYLSHLGLEPVPTYEFDWLKAPNVFHSSPTFKDSSVNLYLYMRENLGREHDMVIRSWADKIMRFCEVRRHSLKRNAIEKWGSQDVARLYMLHLTAFLMDSCVYFRDLRYYNTCLKLMDMGWICKGRRARDIFINAKQCLHYDLFVFRLTICSDYILSNCIEVDYAQSSHSLS